jgi:hypothetical protein
MDREWYYTTGGQQAGPVSWDDLRSLAAQRKLAPGDHVWNDGMPEWAEARTVANLFPAKGPPPLPPSTAVAVVAKPAKVTGEVVLEGLGGAVMPGQMNKMDVKLDGKPLGTGSLVAGVRLPFEASVGHHTVEVAMSGGFTSLLGGFGKKIEGAASGRSYPVEFQTAGHYLLTLTRAKVRGMPPSGVEVSLTAEAAQELALAPVAEEQVEGLVQKGFAAIGRGLSNMRESSRRSQLHGLWESVSGEGMWFLFTKDGGLLRGDGFGAKFRWPDDDSVEVYENGCEATARFQIISLGKHELLLKAGSQTGHFKRGVTITEAEEGRLREEARQRMAELRQQTLATLGGVAAIIAVGGLAVLCGAAATAGEPSGAAPAAEPAFSQEPCSVCSQRGWRTSTLGDGSKIACNVCGGKGFMLRKGS